MPNVKTTEWGSQGRRASRPGYATSWRFGLFPSATVRSVEIARALSDDAASSKPAVAQPHCGSAYQSGGEMPPAEFLPYSDR
jgi:hypothetical protein